MKREYETLLRKVRIDLRDQDAKRKKELQDLEKMKEEEMLKIKKDKKILEQRQRNL